MNEEKQMRADASTKTENELITEVNKPIHNSSTAVWFNAVYNELVSRGKTPVVIGHTSNATGRKVIFGLPTESSEAEA